jgi:hypothetical protein
VGFAVTLTTELIQAIDARVALAVREATQVGTVVEVTSAGNALVVFDGSQGAIPVGVAGNVAAATRDRVLMGRYGTGWDVVGIMRTVYDGAAKLREYVLQQPAASVSIPDIPQTHKHLLFVVHARSDAGGTTAIDTTIRLNGDSGANYSGAHLDLPMGGILGTVTANGQGQAGTFMIPPDGIASNAFGGGFMWLVNYTSTLSKSKQWFTATAATDFGNAGDHKLRWACWCPTVAVAVTQIDITCASGSFKIGSYFGLYGHGA